MFIYFGVVLYSFIKNCGTFIGKYLFALLLTHIYTDTNEAYIFAIHAKVFEPRKCSHAAFCFRRVSCQYY